MFSCPKRNIHFEIGELELDSSFEKSIQNSNQIQDFLVTPIFGKKSP